MDAAAFRSIGVPPSRGAATVCPEHLLSLLQNLSRELREVDVGCAVDRVAACDLGPMRFATEYVQRNKPLIITGATAAWPATRLWDEAYLQRRLGATQVTVDVTPNGRGDAVTDVAGPATGGEVQQWFITPHERRMTLADFFALLKDTRRTQQQQQQQAQDQDQHQGQACAEAGHDAAGGGERDGGAAAGGEGEGGQRRPPLVPYVQHQNSNLTEEFQALMQDVRPGLPWADAVFGGLPEATNLWIGDDRSVTSFHKDHYENLYAVVRGTKVFTLLPPSDVYRMYLTRCPAAQYVPRDELRPDQPHAELAAAGAAGGSCGLLQEAGGEAPPCSGGEHASSTPGPAPANAAAAAAAVPDCPTADACTSPQQPPAAEGDRSSSGGGGRGGSPLVAVLKEEAAAAGGHHQHQHVVWSMVDTTAATAAAAPAAARAAVEEAVPGRAGAAPGGQAQEERQPLFYSPSLPPPLVAEVGPGEVLYLPALWYHQVAQRVAPGQDSVVAVNFWYDMSFDCRYAYYKLAEGLAQALGLAADPAVGGAAEHAAAAAADTDSGEFEQRGSDDAGA